LKLETLGSGGVGFELVLNAVDSDCVRFAVVLRIFSGGVGFPFVL
jgi:hypothetical protein